jgi:hypothetical protein
MPLGVQASRFGVSHRIWSAANNHGFDAIIPDLGTDSDSQRLQLLFSALQEMVRHGGIEQFSSADFLFFLDYEP